MITCIFAKATTECNPDLRERGYIYWRILNGDPAFAKKAILNSTDLTTEFSDILMDDALVDELLLNLGNVSNILMKPVKSTFSTAKPVMKQEKLEANDLIGISTLTISSNNNESPMSPFSIFDSQYTTGNAYNSPHSAAINQPLETATAISPSLLDDLLSNDISFAPSLDSKEIPLIDSNGIKVSCQYSTSELLLKLTIMNCSLETIKDFQLFFDKNR